MRKSALIAASIVSLAFGMAAHAADKIVVGTKNFTEQYILGEIYAGALENAGIPVERKINLGGTLIAHQALVSGDIDMYPEYTGTALISVVKGPVSSDADAVYKTVQDHYAKNFQLTWLKPAGINNGYALIVGPETAAKYNLKTMSDLSKVSKDLVLGAGPEFADRTDGLPGLKAKYGMEFKEFRQFAKLGLRYDALAAGQIQVGNGFATDWQIADKKFVSLADDKGLFPPYYVAPIIRDDILKQFPGAEDVLNKVSAVLDNQVMQQLNALVERDHEEAKDVAAEFLKQHGFGK
ncbi:MULTISPECIES: glycine betaine ABC transporter substrate-binding protein [Chelativorans]|jgi:osmoprotectant transport system substrate-binding protein|nr:MULTISPECIES: glycine betaine ABC transporter substrate-binding protein [Chelativorans]